MAAKRPTKTPVRPLDPMWLRKADELYMRFNMMPGYDRPLLMEYVATALRDAYELGQLGEPYDLTEPQATSQDDPAPAVATVRRARPAPIVSPSAAPRVVRRVTKG